jgi:hypothetical protein
MIRSTFVGGSIATLLVALAGVFAVAIPASQPAMAASSGECVTARVDEPFRLPDGRLYPAGVLTICDGGAYSPVDNFQRILVGGSAIGLFVSEKRGAELRSAGSPQVVFRRGADSSLNLIGYTVPSTGRSVAYRMKNQDDVWQARSQPEVGTIAAAPVAAVVHTAGSR